MSNRCVLLRLLHTLTELRNLYLSALANPHILQQHIPQIVSSMRVRVTQINEEIKSINNQLRILAC